jgi:hypothetical protein
MEMLSYVLVLAGGEYGEIRVAAVLPWCPIALAMLLSGNALK